MNVTEKKPISNIVYVLVEYTPINVEIFLEYNGDKINDFDDQVHLECNNDSENAAKDIIYFKQQINGVNKYYFFFLNRMSS